MTILFPGADPEVAERENPGMSGNPLADFLVATAIEAPRSEAWSHAGTARDHAGLRRDVEALATELRELGIRPGDRLAAHLENGPFFLTTTFAAAWLGAVLVPLNLRATAADHERVLELAEVRAVLLEAADLDPIPPAWTGGRPCLGPAFRTSDGLAPERVRADAPAHLYFTSGSTGEPKGVVLTVDNVRTHALRAIEELELSATDTWAHIAPMFHLADAWATLAVTAAGGRHVFLPRFEALGAIELLEDSGTTLTNLVPTMLNLMVHEPTLPQRDLTAMRLVLSGGAPISPELVATIMRSFGCPYVQTYGMTETSPYLTLSKIPPELEPLDDATRFRLVARTGRPFAGVELRVVDEAGHPVRADDEEVGEIQVRGATVTPGYWNAPEVTRAAFTEDGFLKTGDLATIDRFGFVQIVDRKKDVIITGGENVYSVEVEGVLAAHPDVLEVAVFGTPDEVWGEVVTAVVVPARGLELEADRLADHVREHLSSYKVPRRWRFLDALPRLGSGKIAKRALRDEAARGES